MSSTYHRDESIENLQGMLDEWFILGGVINIGDWIPWLNWLDLQGYIKRMKALDKKLREFFKYVLEDHKAKGMEDSVPKDMVDVLLQLVDDPNLEVKITTDSLMGLILVSFLLFLFSFTLMKMLLNYAKLNKNVLN